MGARYGGTVAAAGQLESSVDVIWVAAAIATALPLLVVGVHLSRQGR